MVIWTTTQITRVTKESVGETTGARNGFPLPFIRGEGQGEGMHKNTPTGSSFPLTPALFPSAGERENRTSATVSSRPSRRLRTRERAALTTELVVAIAVLATATLPLSVSFLHEMKLIRNCYYRAVAMEIIDSEMEILAAGEWRAFPEGAENYLVRAEAAKNLPPGYFRLNKKGKTLRLEWVPQFRAKGIHVSREWENQAAEPLKAIERGPSPPPK